MDDSAGPTGTAEGSPEDLVEVVVGRIGKAHGVRGEVSVDVRTDAPEERFADEVVLRTQPAELGPLRVVASRWHAGRLLVRFAGVADRDAATRLRGAVLLVDVDRTDDTGDPDEFYDYQLVGLAVRTAEGAAVGTVEEVVHLPGQELLAVRRSTGQEALVPFVSAIVTAVEVDAGYLIIEPPTGLLDEGADVELAAETGPGGSPKHQPRAEAGTDCDAGAGPDEDLDDS